MPSSAEGAAPSHPDPTWISARPVGLTGSSLAHWALKRAGWELVFEGLPSRQGVLIGYPHTSNWDFVLALVAKWALGLHVSFWAKDSLFSLPLLGAWLRWLGGIPIDRRGARGVVGGMVQRFADAQAADQLLWLALSPEGTRAYQPHWRTGFYQLASQAQVPMGLMFFDFGRKRVGVDHFLLLCGEAERDMAAIATYYAGVQGKRPDQAAPIRLR